MSFPCYWLPQHVACSNSLLAARFSVPDRNDWFVDTGGIQCVCRTGLYMGTFAVPVPHLQSWLDSQWMSLLLARLARNILSHWSDTNASSETTPTAPSKALRSQSPALIAIGCYNTCVQHSLLAARLSVPHRVDWWVDTGGIQCVYRILYGNTCFCLFLTYNLDLTVTECHFCWPDWQETRVLSHWSDTSKSGETTPPSGKALGSQSRALIAYGYHNMLCAAFTACSAAFSST